MASTIEVNCVNGSTPPWPANPLSVPPTCAMSGSWTEDGYATLPWVQCVVPIGGQPCKTTPTQCNADNTWSCSFSGLPATATGAQLNANLYADQGCTTFLTSNQGPLITVSSAAAAGSCPPSASKKA